MSRGVQDSDFIQLYCGFQRKCHHCRKFSALCSVLHLYFLYLGKLEMAAFQIAVHLITDVCQCLTFLFTSLADCGVKEQ